MSVTKDKLLAALSPALPTDILNHLLKEYQSIKQQFFLRRFQTSELNGGRFGECVVRLLQYLSTGTYTAFGTHITNTGAILDQVSRNGALNQSLRSLIPNLTRVIMGVRNSRDVAHVGVTVNPNHADALLICQCADWILVELIRNFYSCSIDEARQIVISINEVHIPILADVDGFIRVQNTELSARDKTMVILYYKQPNKVKDVDLIKWLRYKNQSRYKTEILRNLDDEALIHYENGICSILTKGTLYVENKIPVDLIA
jgi:hypothetical protein